MEITLKYGQTILNQSKERMSIIVYNKASNFVFNRSWVWALNKPMMVLREAFKNAPKFTEKLLKKYYPDYDFNNIPVSFETPEDYVVLDLIDLPNYRCTDQAALNEVKARYANELNADVKNSDCPISIKVPQEVKQAAKIVIWYDYLSTIQIPFMSFNPNSLKGIAGINLFQQIKKTKSNVDFDGFSYSRSMSQFKKNLNDYLNGTGSMFSIPSLLSPEFKEIQQIFVKCNLPKQFSILCKIVPNKEANYTSFKSVWLQPQKLNGAMKILKYKLKTEPNSFFYWRNRLKNT